LLEISKTIPLLGNLASTVQAIKEPAVFFSSLEKCEIRFPAISYAYPNIHEVIFLRKKIGGCGGTHITYANQSVHSEDCYYQQYIDGRSISLLFLANHRDIEVIGFNEQWISPSISEPFRYGGAVSNIDLPSHVQHQLIDAAKKLTKTYELVGLNSLDAILKDDMIFVLEINPRLSATVDLYDYCYNNLIERHIKVCLQNIKDSVDEKIHYVTTSSKAHAIVYADFNCIVPINFEWPDWVVDTPKELTEVLSYEPLCTVLAVADNAEEAKQLAHIRVRIMQLEISKTTKPKK
jgi:predicted ATP-grasp superfamily ATP-dependent carboligase